MVKKKKPERNGKLQTATLLRPFVRSLKFDRFQTLRNNMRQDVQTDATGNIQQSWELLANNVAPI